MTDGREEEVLRGLTPSEVAELWVRHSIAQERLDGDRSVRDPEARMSAWGEDLWVYWVLLLGDAGDFIDSPVVPKEVRLEVVVAAADMALSQPSEERRSLLLYLGDLVLPFLLTSWPEGRVLLEKTYNDSPGIEQLYEVMRSWE